ncbi:colipase [Octodon degus]|uniref:Colipase n=1 Tax=Octodon degus TaxID=10160 RepID=A0A6P3EJM5_OCTDE|nr:colipase [Octodon degus]
MEKVLVLVLLTLAVAYAAPDPRGIIVNLDNGELCMNSAQCKSKCCQHDNPLALARCADKASENSGCSPQTIYGIYYVCPCERGLTCEADKTIIGAITNTNYGICQDPSSKK